MKRLGSLFLIWLVFVGFTFSDRYLAIAFAKSNMSIGQASIDDHANTLYIKVTDPEPRQLCNSTKRLLARLRQQIKLELYYAKSVAANNPDLRFYGDYYESVYQLGKAKEYYKLCLYLEPDEYRNGLHQKAKAGLNRLKS